MKKKKKSDIRELQRIQESIPQELKDNLLRNAKVSPTISRITREAMKSPEMPEEKKQQFQTLLDTGLLDQEEKVENKTTIKKINKYLEGEIAKAVVAGRLSKPKNDKLLDKYKKICRKLSRTNISKS